MIFTFSSCLNKLLIILVQFCLCIVLPEKSIIHRDVKSSNILLNEGFRAKVADFGFARMGPMEADQTHIETKVKGTVGYVDPEYLKTYHLTPQSDVYSFGILLLEILSARRPVEIRKNPNERITVRWVRSVSVASICFAISWPAENEDTTILQYRCSKFNCKFHGLSLKFQ